MQILTPHESGQGTKSHHKMTPRKTSAVTGYQPISPHMTKELLPTSFKQAASTPLLLYTRWLTATAATQTAAHQQTHRFATAQLDTAAAAWLAVLQPAS